LIKEASDVKISPPHQNGIRRRTLAAERLGHSPECTSDFGVKRFHEKGRDKLTFQSIRKACLFTELPVKFTHLTRRYSELCVTKSASTYLLNCKKALQPGLYATSAYIFRRTVEEIRHGKMPLSSRSTDVTQVRFFSPLMPPHVPYGLRGLPSRLWPKCNRLLRLGRP
jgi:hypothetical protein